MFLRISKSLPKALQASTIRQFSSTIRTRTQLSSLPKIIEVSKEEKEAGALNWKNLELANRALHHDGLVVLENVISHSKLDFLNEKMVVDAKTLQDAGENSPYNYNKGNIQQDPPMVKKYFDREIFLNPQAIQVTSSVLGPNPRLSFISGNSALPPTAGEEPKSQPIHSDADFEHPCSPFALVVNVPLVEMTSENGSTEVWLGTQSFSKDAQEGKHGDRDSGRIKLDLLDSRRQERPPIQPIVKKGSLVVRDLRLWHGGKPNLTNETRVMLAMIHFAPWFRNAMQINFSEDLCQDLENYGTGVQIQGKYLPEKEILGTYLNGTYGNAFDFNQEDQLQVSF